MVFMKKYADFIVFLISYIITSFLFTLFLNWYDTGDLNFSGTRGIVIGGVLVGCVALWAEKKINKNHGLPARLTFPFILRHVLFAWCGLAGIFAISYPIDKILDLGVIGFVSNTSNFLIIPFVIIFYLPMMFPFGILLGISNSIFVWLGRKYFALGL